MSGRDGAAVWHDAVLAARLFAVDPAGLGGVCLHARAGSVRDSWLAELRDALPAHLPMRRVPLNIADERLLGGLDLAATLRAGKPIAERGLLAECDGGVIVLAMAERMTTSTAARLTATADAGEVVLERDGLGRRYPCRAGMVVLDEGGEDERPPVALLDRCAFLVDLEPIALRDVVPVDGDEAIAGARRLLPRIESGEDMLEALGATAEALGVPSSRALLMALRTARAAAALEGRTGVTEADVMIAARLVLGPRATQLPQPSPPPSDEDSQQDEPDQDQPDDDGGPDDQSDTDDRPPEGMLDDVVLAAAKAAIPAGLLAALQSSAAPAKRANAEAGRVGGARQSQKRGRPIGTQRGKLVAGARLNVLETLRCAAPWQAMRRRAAPHATAKVLVHPEDFRITRFEERTQSTVIFVVDASGSSALNRLGEAKGAVELLLADCYVRRDQVALMAFRGQSATLLLPPTSSLVRAKRSLAGLAGGGGTPIANAIDQASELADHVRRKGQTPFIVMLTDGRANIGKDGSPGRAKAGEDAKQAARTLRSGGFACMLIDTSPVPQPQGQDLAGEMGATYLPLPYADANVLSKAVKATRDA